MTTSQKAVWHYEDVNGIPTLSTSSHKPLQRDWASHTKVFFGLIGCSYLVRKESAVRTLTVRQVRVLMIAGRKGDREDHPSRDTWVASVYWEEWENGVKEHIDKLIARRQ